ncbi:hypothetical protein HDA40_001900 [Hamadaea flava]|uniref:Replication-relaxation family protein n=2 Tax=Hamadaea flava TaxID=1742688 RepID=A0ABV8LEW4_9ACTN|nr:replication-relaxation family protein [Hamadaea flava]MCP2323393.1 hypothetical protein [Hamadaea flava]
MLGILPHLTDRDRLLIRLLDRHQVLTTGQIHRLFFNAVRTCQIRLAALRKLGILDAFRYARLDGGSDPWHWTLGLAGARWQAAATGRASPTERSHRERILRLSATSTLTHRVMTNEFFVRLAARTRQDSATELLRWWPENDTLARFLAIRPDGHGVWHDDRRAVGFFLETDMGTENLPRLINKLPAYEQMIRMGGPVYPVLFWLPNVRRERHLAKLVANAKPGVQVLTSTHDLDPAERVWWSAATQRRLRIADIDCDHGLDHIRNPNWVDGVLDLSDQVEEQHLSRLNRSDR